MNEGEVEAILSGAVSDPELAAALASLRAVANVPLQERTATDHIRMVAHAARSANPSARTHAKFKSRSKRRWATALTAGVAWKIVVASAALAASSAAAATGTLPDPVQSAVSAAVSRFGIVIPDGVDQPDLGQSDQGEVSQPGLPDQDHVDDPSVDETDQPQGSADWPGEQSDQAEVDQAETDAPDESDESEQVSDLTDEEQNGQADEDEPDSDNGQSDRSPAGQADQPEDSQSDSD